MRHLRGQKLLSKCFLRGNFLSYELLGNLEEVKAAWGKLGDDWVIAGNDGRKGSVSAWGQGAAETAEGLQVLLLSSAFYDCIGINRLKTHLFKRDGFLRVRRLLRY